jgi:hypothetical protein
LSGKPKPVRSYAAFFFPAFTLAHRARCAAAIFLRADADIVRFTVAEAVAAAGCDRLRALAHRFFCATLIFLRADADKVRCLFDAELPKAASAAVKRCTSCCALFSSFFKCPTTPDKFTIWFPPSAQDFKRFEAACAATRARFKGCDCPAYDQLPLRTEPYYDPSNPMTYEELVDFLEHKMSMSHM